MSTMLFVQGAMAAATLSFASIGPTAASPATSNSLGAAFVVIAKGTTSTVEITLHPSAPFDTVKVEAGSGVSVLSPPCAFSRVVAGGHYVCRVNVTQDARQASLTLNVVGEKTLDPANPPIIEVSHFTISNDSFVAPAAVKPRTMGPAMTRTPDPATAK